MYMKASHSEDNANKSIRGSTRRHIISRLNKAAKYAKELVELLSDKSARASDTDLLEAKAYAYSLTGAEEFEKQSEGIKNTNGSPQRWIKCLTFYSAARVIYNSLLTATKKDLFKEMLASTIDPSIRYAAYQHRLPRTVAVSTVVKRFFPKKDSELVEAVEKLDPDALVLEEPSQQGLYCVVLTSCSVSSTNLNQEQHHLTVPMSLTPSHGVTAPLTLSMLLSAKPSLPSMPLHPSFRHIYHHALLPLRQRRKLLRTMMFSSRVRMP